MEASATVVSTPVETRSVDVALQARAAARLKLIRDACYTPNFAFDRASDAIFRDNGARMSCSPVNFVVGEHFRPGAEYWHDLNKPARDLHQTMLNAYAHNTRLKENTGKNNRAKPPFVHGRMVLEALVDVTRDGDKTVHTVSGWRPWYFYAANRASFAESLSALSVARGGKKRAAAAQPDDSPKKKRRKDGDAAEPEADGAAVPAAAATATAAAAQLDEDSFSPLAFGLGASFQESVDLAKRIEDARAAEAKQLKAAANRSRRKTKDTPPTVDEMAAKPLALQQVDVANIMAFQYLHTKSEVDFHLSDVVSYIQPERYAISPQADPSPTAHQLVEPRAFLDYSARDAADNGLPYYNRTNVINPDNIFTKESAMSYFTHDTTTGTQIVCDEQTNLGNYASGGAHDEDDALREELMNMRDDGTDAHHTKLVRDLAKSAPDSVPPNWPFPALVFLVSQNVATPEGFALRRLPFPIGHKLTADDMMGDSNPLDHEVKEWTRCINGLRTYEDEMHRAHLKKNPNAPKQGIISALSASIQRSGQPADISNILNDVPLAVPELPLVKMKEVMTFQQNVVERSLYDEAQRIKTKPHETLFVKQVEKESMDDHVGMMDLLPTHFIFHKNRLNLLRDNIETFLRERYSVQLDTLGPDERRAEEQAIEREVASLIKSLSENYVDDIQAYFTENDMILQLHQKFQAQFGILASRATDHVDDLKKTLTGTELTEALVQAQNGYRAALMDLRGNTAEETLETLRTSDNIADVLRAPDFRTWFLKNCTPAVMESLGATQPVLSQDTKPFNSFIQELADHLFVDANVRAPGLQGAMLMLYTALESQIWLLERLLPAGNTIFFGASGVGKSHLARAIMRMLWPGMAKSMSNFSTQAFTTASNMDNIWIIQEEAKASLLALNKEDADRGGSDMLNMWKDRQTKFISTASRAWADPETGKVSTVTSVSSQHNASTMLSNMTQDKVDPPLARRNLFVTQPGLRGDVGHSAEQNQKIGLFDDNSSTRESDRRWQITMAMYTTIKTLQKAAVLPECDSTHSNMIIVSALKELGVKVDGTELHRFTQFAMDYQLFYAAHMVCWSPYQAKYHSEPNAAPRWSGHAIVNLVSPFLTTSTEATVLALTALAFSVVPTHIDSFLKDLVKELHLHNPANIVYRRIDAGRGGDRNAPVSYDTNYVVLEGYNEHQIINSVAARNEVYVIRAQDILSFIAVLNKSLATGKNYVVAENGTAADGRPLHVVRDEASEVVSMQPFLFEKMTSTGKGGKSYRVCVSIQFLVTYFGIGFNADKEWAKVGEKPVSVTEHLFNKDAAARMSFAEPAHSAMVRAIDRVLSNRTLNKTPMDPPGGLPDVCNEFMTALSPNPVRIGIDVPVTPTTHRRHNYRTNLHGVLLKARFKRNEAKPGITRENSHVLPPTVAERLRLRNETARMDDDQKWQYMHNSHLAYTSDKYDGGYVINTQFLTKLGHVDAPCFLKLAGFDDRALACFKDMKSTEKLPDALPIGFEPFGYMLQKAICDEMGFKVGNVLYPENTIYNELHNSMLIERTKETPMTLRDPKDNEQIVDFYDIGKSLPTAKISFAGVDEAEDFFERDRHALLGLMSRYAPPPPAPRLPPMQPDNDEGDAMDVS